MDYADDEMCRLQKLEKQALVEFIRVCEELNLKWFIISGTYLGAIRHGGFIPWDDDMDVGMLRKDYDLFIRKAQGILGEDYYLQIPELERATPYTYAKLRINGTLFVERNSRMNRMHKGVYIDIVPFDELPDDDNANVEQYEKAQKLERLYFWRQTPFRTQELHTARDLLLSIIRFIVFVVLHLVPRKWLLSQIDKNATKYNGLGQKGIGCLFQAKRKGSYLPKEEFDNLFACSFDGISVWGPGNPDEYLTNMYGDYMSLPPENERKGHRPYCLELSNGEN